MRRTFANSQVLAASLCWLWQDEFVIKKPFRHFVVMQHTKQQQVKSTRAKSKKYKRNRLQAGQSFAAKGYTKVTWIRRDVNKCLRICGKSSNSSRRSFTQSPQQPLHKSSLSQQYLLLHCVIDAIATGMHDSK